MALSDSVKSASEKINEYLKGKRLRFFVLVGLIIAIVIALTVFLNQKTYTVLYSGMEASETGEVLSLLSEMGVDAKTEGEDTVLVPDGQVDEVRLELAAQGYPSTGVNDYSIYSSASGLGTTDSEKQVYYKYQLQANLRTTIMQMEKVENAVVNLDLGEDSSFVFSENEKPPTASIMLTLRGDETLNDGEVRAITELVAKSVSGLETENVRIVDSQMTLYSTDGEPGVQSADSHITLQQNVQNQLQEQIVNLLGPVFGEDNVLAEVSVILNFDNKQTQSVEYSAPTSSPEGLVVSMQELVEAITNDADGGGTPAGLDANGSASQYLERIGESNAVYYNVSREVNYEINQTTTEIQEAQGQIEDLSVSVILNSSNISDYVDEVKNLVATATGAATDKITVEMLPFIGSEAAQEADAAAAEQAQQYQEQLMNSQQSAQTLRIVIIAIAALIIMLFLFAIVKMFRPRQVEAVGMGGIDIIVDDDGNVMDATEEGVKDIEIKDKDTALSALEDFIGKNPESVANLLRNWLNEE